MARVPILDKKAVHELGRIGNNINQLARIVNGTEAKIFYTETINKLEDILFDFNEIIKDATRTYDKILLEE